VAKPELKEFPWERDERRRKLLRTVLLALVALTAGPLVVYCVVVGVVVLITGDWIARLMWTLIATSGVAAAVTAIRAWLRNSFAATPLLLLPLLWEGAVVLLALVWPVGR
jgi:hypothetical protein